MYKIRCRVAELGTTVSPPGSAKPKPSTRRRPGAWASTSTSKPPQADEGNCDGESNSETETDSDSDTSSDKAMADFIAEECLFCSQTSKDFDENLSHMHQTHSLIVPFQPALAVDLQTLIWFLHMVIFSYRECICCGTRRRTIEAVQQHMTSKGHCRFNMTEEMSGFYDMDSLGQQAAEIRSHPDDYTLRLPSGKLLAHRSYVDSTPKSRMREKSPTAGEATPSALPASSSSSQQSDSAAAQALTKRDRKDQTLATQFSRLRTGDQMSLMHLPESQRRALLVAQKKKLDEAKRAERRKRGRLDNVGNKTAVHTNYYKQEVPVYMGG